MPERESDLRWLALGRVAGLGYSGFKRLVDFFGDPTRAFSASPKTLDRVEGLSRLAVKGIVTFRGWDALTSELDLAAATDARLIRYCDETYPWRLREISDPPPILFAKGSLEQWDPAVGVVGSRSATDYGRKITRQLCEGLGSVGICIVSGMARGIDATAHAAALATAGSTIAVFGSGVDVIYPKENRALAEEIAACGAVISEFPMGTPPLPCNFPLRNRIISGLSLGVVVIEAAERSGSLITARLALEQGREIFAVPGQVGTSQSRGTHNLIKQGAKLVEGIADIIEEIAPQLLQQAAAPTESSARRLTDVPEPARGVLQLLQSGPLAIDQLIHSSGLSAARMSEILLTMELQGFLSQLPGKRFELNYSRASRD